MKPIDKIKLLNIKNQFDANQKILYPNPFLIENFKEFHSIAKNHAAFCFAVKIKIKKIFDIDDFLYENEIEDLIQKTNDFYEICVFTPFENEIFLISKNFETFELLIQNEYLLID